ncbi:hypothetical protein PMKS-003817 [Pichia membranifaciens]|uniref:Ams2/SPT21 N-terminal domain-containing protein n=1 Tax=Pichia membranifaciens TaxID=4926 RepID=A0A1Q2YL71_9ASCO|nr:hypothetical protein PMKS-003817 [Pichia membranifaciens]
MSSADALMPQPFDKNITLKVLYTFDDRNTFLARSVKPVSAKIITLPNQPPHNGTQIGCVDLKKCLDLLRSVSPERFQKDMIASRVDEEVDARGEPISSRFSNFPKNSKGDEDAQPTRARKSKSFIQSVVKIGDNAVGSKNKKTSLATVKALPSKRCVNCMSTTTPPYKFHKDGIFQLANSGYLCTVCNFYQTKGNTKSLRERGELGARGLLDDPYSKVTTAKRSKKKRGTASNPNSSSIDTSSSPVLSSPMNLQNGFICKSKKQNVANSSLSQHNVHETIHEVENFKHEDLMALLKLESTFANYKDITNHNENLHHMSTQPPTELDPIEDMFRIPESKYAVSGLPSSSSSSLKGQSKNNTPNGNGEEYYRDYDNVPIDATKLNTTLIPMDDDDKENYPPSDMPPPNVQIYSSNNANINPHVNSTSADDDGNDDANKDGMHNLFGTNDISPSIQRIIESFSNEPSSPTRASNADWNYNFFEDTSSQGGGNSGNQHTECDDPEIDRILAQHEKYEITPRDPGTAQSQQNADSPNGMRTTPGNTAFEMHMSSTDKSMLNPRNINPGASSATAADGKTSESSKGQDEPGSTKKTRLMMPSSPFFNMHNEDLSKDDKTLDTTQSLINWDTKSSPVTEPLSSSYGGKP